MKKFKLAFVYGIVKNPYDNFDPSYREAVGDDKYVEELKMAYEKTDFQMGRFHNVGRTIQRVINEARPLESLSRDDLISKLRLIELSVENVLPKHPRPLATFGNGLPKPLENAVRHSPGFGRCSMHLNPETDMYVGTIFSSKLPDGSKGWLKIATYSADGAFDISTHKGESVRIGNNYFHFFGGSYDILVSNVKIEEHFDCWFAAQDEEIALYHTLYPDEDLSILLTIREVLEESRNGY